MDQLVFSNFYPAQLTKQSIQDVLLGLIKSSPSTLIASGYISNDAITEINKIIEDNREKVESFSLFIGMHYIEGFTKNQYIASQRLNSYLCNEGIGGVYVSANSKFHGKIYCFTNEQGVNTGLIGSANLSSFIKNLDRTYETMLLVNEPRMAKELLEKTHQIVEKLGQRIDEAKLLTDEDFVSSKIDLSNFEKVRKLDDRELKNLMATVSQFSFDIPLKADLKQHAKSNLNVFFGEGRRNKRGFVIPRPWYEVEIIVSKSITGLPGFPYLREFKVVTNDGWTFDCSTQGDYAKNFRSARNLSILGKWIKGKLEVSGALTTGELVTPDVLHRYGKDSMTLRSTDHPDTWLLEL